MASKKGFKAYVILATLAVLTVSGWAGWTWWHGDRETTDDAQLEADVVPLAPRVGGAVLKVYVEDNQLVKKGDLLVELDPRDYQYKVMQAEAELEAARTQAESAGSKTRDAAQVAAARASLSHAEAEARKAAADLARARKLRAENAISPVELETAQSTAEKARAASAQAEAQLRVAEEAHSVAGAKVKAAEAAVEQARAQLEYTKVFAPRDGTLSKVAVQEGQLLQPGQVVAQLVAASPFVVANFKETQIGRMKPGQKVRIAVDALPGQELDGKVESLAAATGARFSLLPPDNASGNFVKVVQRVPVKISLEGTLDATALKAGLSADVTVFVR